MSARKQDYPRTRRYVSLPAITRLTSFTAFWPFYLREHANRGTCALHYGGTSLVVILLATALVTRWAPLFWLLPIAGYGFAWVAHFAIERNRPATFTYPLWSFAADFRMWFLWLTGRLGPELDRAGGEAWLIA